MFIVAPFLVAKKWKQPKCLSFDECITNQLAGVEIAISYSHVGRPGLKAY
jgi:hypothetical protein